MKSKIPYAVAINIYNTLSGVLAPVLKRCEVAGSIRRKKRVVGDIEIVAVPFRSFNLMGEPTDEDIVGHFLRGTDSVQEIIKNGPRYKQFIWADCQVDLFLQPDPETWGVNFMIRTGPADYVKKMMVPRWQGGLKPSDLSVNHARVWRGQKVLSTPQELSVFKLWGMDYIKPEDR